MTRSVSPRFWLARIRPVVVAVTATAMVALAACSSTVPSTSGGSATSSAQASTPLVGAVATQLDAAIGQAMTTASIPGAIVGIWGPAGNYVRTFGVAAQANHRGNIQIKLPECFGQSIRGPILLLARDA